MFVACKMKLLEAVLSLQFNTAISNKVPSGSTYCLVTDGILPLRQCLFPEAINRKGISLHDHFYQYFDIIKEFHSSFHPDQEFESLTDILYRILYYNI